MTGTKPRRQVRRADLLESPGLRRRARPVERQGRIRPAAMRHHADRPGRNHQGPCLPRSRAGSGLILIRVGGCLPGRYVFRRPNRREQFLQGLRPGHPLATSHGPDNHGDAARGLLLTPARAGVFVSTESESPPPRQFDRLLAPDFVIVTRTPPHRVRPGDRAVRSAREFRPGRAHTTLPSS